MTGQFTCMHCNYSLQTNDKISTYIILALIAAFRRQRCCSVNGSSVTSWKSAFSPRPEIGRCRQLSVCQGISLGLHPPPQQHLAIYFRFRCRGGKSLLAMLTLSLYTCYVSAGSIAAASMAAQSPCGKALSLCNAAATLPALMWNVYSDNAR